MITKNIHLMVGLPGSGKSSWAKNNINKVINLDNYNILTDSDEVEREIGYSLWFGSVEKDICIDTLITTNVGLNKLIEIVKKRFNRSINNVKFIIHFWKENRELCLKNDEGRRDISSGVTIRNAPLEYPNISITNVKYEIVEHEVYEKTFYEKKFVKYSDILKSERWSVGGSWCNCWGDSGTIEPDEPKEFDEFDNLLEELCPNITFLQYKKIRKECVTCEEDSERDYYGGCEYFNYWSCDMKKLYDKLVEFNLIN